MTLAVEVPVQAAFVAKAAPGTCPVLRLDIDTLQTVLHKLSARDLLQASAVSVSPCSHRIARDTSLLLLSALRRPETYPLWKNSAPVG